MKDWTRMKMTIKDFYISNLRKQVNNAKGSLKGNFMKEKHESGFKYIEFSVTGETARRKWRVELALDQHEKGQWKITVTISATEKSTITVVAFSFHHSFSSFYMKHWAMDTLSEHFSGIPRTSQFAATLSQISFHSFFIHSLSCTQQKFF